MEHGSCDQRDEADADGLQAFCGVAQRHGDRDLPGRRFHGALNQQRGHGRGEVPGRERGDGVCIEYRLAHTGEDATAEFTALWADAAKFKEMGTKMFHWRMRWACGSGLRSAARQGILGFRRIEWALSAFQRVARLWIIWRYQAGRNRRNYSSQLLPHDFNQDSLVTLAIELGIKNLLPPSKIEPALGDRHDHLVMTACDFKCASPLSSPVWWCW